VEDLACGLIPFSIRFVKIGKISRRVAGELAMVAIAEGEAYDKKNGQKRQDDADHYSSSPWLWKSKSPDTPAETICGNSFMTFCSIELA
jgi:hypothetical protein